MYTVSWRFNNRPCYSRHDTLVSAMIQYNKLRDKGFDDAAIHLVDEVKKENK